MSAPARTSLPTLDAAPGSSDRVRRPVLAKGFRLFFLLAAASAVTILPLWLAMLFSGLRIGAYVEPVSWHAHELLFGFTSAVVAGFLLTAVGNWTKRETVVGGALFALGALWLAGRVAMLTAHLLPAGVAAAIDVAFLPALGVALARPLIATGNRRNFVMLLVLGALAAANAAVHLDALGAARGGQRVGVIFATDVVILLCLIITGRVLPMFTRNATGAEGIVSSPKLDVLTVVAMALLTALDALSWSRADAVAGFVAVLAVARAARWGTARGLRVPLVWILHAGYAWIVVGLALRAVTGLTGAVVPPSAALHALTVGAIGSLTLGMMARVSLGHTGRPLEPPRTAVVAFALITLAAATRVGLPIAAPGLYRASLAGAGALWSLAFALFLFGYARVLTSPRADGKPG